MVLLVLHSWDFHSWWVGVIFVKFVVNIRVVILFRVNFVFSFFIFVSSIFVIVIYSYKTSGVVVVVIVVVVVVVVCVAILNRVSQAAK